MITKNQAKKLLETQVMTTAQACEYLDVTRQSLHFSVKSGRIEPLQQSGRETLYWRKDIEEYKQKYSRKK